MKINVEELKALVEAGDESAIEKHILNQALEKSDVYSVLEKGDIVAAAAVNAEVKSELDSEKDKHHDTALTTFKEKKLPGLLDAAKEEVRKEFNQDETPEQKQIRELTEKFNKEKQKSARAEIRAKLIELATGEEIGLDAAFINKHVDSYIPSALTVNDEGEVDIETVVSAAKDTLKAFATDFNTAISTKVEEKLKGAARDDLGGGVGGGDKKPTLGEELANSNSRSEALKKQGKFFG